MLLTEFNDKTELSKELHDEEQDQSVKAIDDLRTSKLTFEQLNKIRRARDSRNYELAEKQKLIQQQYSPAADTDSL